MSRRRRRVAPDAPETDDVRVVAVGTGLWAAALLALLPFADALASSGRGWWLWTCAVGVVLGLVGVRIARRRRERGRAGAQDGDGSRA